MKKRRIIIWIGIITLVFLLCDPIYGESMDSIWNQQMESIDLSDVDQVISQIQKQAENPYLDSFDFRTVMKKAASGQLIDSIKDIGNYSVKYLFYEMVLYSKLIGKLIILSVLSAMLKNLSASFHNRSVGQIGFYVCYIVLIILLVQSFEIVMEVCQSTIGNMILIMQALLPTLITLMITSGSFSSGTVFEPIIIFSVEIIGMFIKNIILPLIFFTTVLQIVNHLSEKGILKKLTEFFYQVIEWALKGVVMVFVGIMGVQGLTAPIVDGVMNQTAKSAVGTFVPVIGEALNSAVDLVMNCSLLVKNAVGVGGIILLAVICFIPIIKVAVFLISYKFTAALIEPISDKRIVECISGIGQSCSLLFASLIAVSILFIITITIMIGAGNITAMMR